MNQVVNLLHYRSLNYGEIPVNVQFGGIAINTFNALNPTLPSLVDASVFIGTGGDARVDEDGTDRTADVLIASVRTGEVPQTGQGWVRYQMRGVRASGDTMVGDLTMSGASLRFTPGATGNAELVLPTDTTATVGESGSLRFSTLTGSIQVHDGTEWIDIKSGADFQVAATAPTLRTTLTALQDGDKWWNSSINASFTFISGAWVPDAETTESQVTTTPPTLRSNGDTLQPGDLFFDPTLDTQFVWDGGGWQKVIGSPNDYQVQATAPTTRSSGDPLVPGDQWYDTTNSILKLWDGVAWFDVVQAADFQVAATAPTTNTYGSPLEDGDLYYNTTLSRLYVRASGAWVTTDTFRDYQSAATQPTLRSDGVSALADGDFYYNTTLSRLYVRESGVWVSSDSYTDFQTRTGVTPTLRDNGVDALVEGDWWYDNSATVPFLHFWDGTQWVNTTDGGAF